MKLFYPNLGKYRDLYFIKISQRNLILNSLSILLLLLNPKKCRFTKFDILDDCNFGAPYLHHSNFVFDKTYWTGFQFKSSFYDKKFSSIQDVMKIWHAF